MSWRFFGLGGLQSIFVHVVKLSGGLGAASDGADNYLTVGLFDAGQFVSRDGTVSGIIRHTRRVTMHFRREFANMESRFH